MKERSQPLFETAGFLFETLAASKRSNLYVYLLPPHCLLLNVRLPQHWFMKLCGQQFSAWLG
jgi:hypothetical protein